MATSKKNIETGDLVKFYRRKRPGVGVVVKHIPDIIRIVPYSIELEQLGRRWKYAKTWKERKIACDNFVERCGLEEEQAMAFLYYNSFRAAWVSRDTGPVKKNFVYIHWVKRPSCYEMREIRETRGWYPTKWFKKVE